MNENKGIRLWQWAVVLLVLCNTGLIITLWLKPCQKDLPKRESPRDFVIRSLQFAPDQVKKYDVLVQAHQQAMKKLRHDADDIRQALFAGIKDNDQRKADSLAHLVAANQEEIEKVTYSHFAQVRAICTDTQKKEFDNIIGEVTKKMSGGHPRPPGSDGPPPGGGHEPPPPGDGPPPPDGPQNP